MGTWFNTDGLNIEYGTTKAVAGVAGTYKTYGELSEVIIDLDLTTLLSTPTIIENNFKFPTGVRIQEVVVVAHTAATGSGATLDLGLIREDRATELDYNGILAAMALTSIDATGEQTTVVPGVAPAGALMGTATTQVGYLVANYNTAAYTAGRVRIRVRYYGFGTITQ